MGEVRRHPPRRDAGDRLRRERTGLQVGVAVTLADGTQLLADIVVGADGPHSAVRAMAFGPEEQFVKPLGGYNAWFSAPDHVGLDGWYLMYLAPGGLNASMRPTHDPAMAKAGLAFASEPIAYDRRDLDEQRQILVDRFAGAGWQCDALLTAAQWHGYQPGTRWRLPARR